MYGRYGVDQLSRFMLVVIFILCVLSLFIKGSFMSLLILVLIILTYYRMFSKNIYKRAAENEKYLKFIGKFKRNGNGYNGGYKNNYGNYQNNYGGGYTGSRANTQDRKNYKYFFVSEKNSIFALAKRKVAQLVAHYVRDVGVGRSNRLFPTERLNSYRIKSFLLPS
mgnify:CR=1 FL=1